MRTPTIHMNGSGASRLQEAYAAAYSALGEAIAAVQAAAPNARDYYPQGAQAYGQAADEHSARLAQLVAVQDDMLSLHDSCEVTSAPRTPAAGGGCQYCGGIRRPYERSNGPALAGECSCWQVTR